MSDDKTYHGECFCGAVKYDIKGEPQVMAICHCNDCRHWSAGPVNTASLWPSSDVSVTQGADKIGTYNKTPGSSRKFCRICGGHIFTEHPEMGMTDVYGATIANFTHKPALHVYYGQTVLHIKDGLPKMKDMPAEMGGSGETLPE